MSPAMRSSLEGKWYSSPPLDRPASAATASSVTAVAPSRTRMVRRAARIRARAGMASELGVGGATSVLYRPDGRVQRMAVLGTIEAASSRALGVKRWLALAALTL